MFRGISIAKPILDRDLHQRAYKKHITTLSTAKPQIDTSAPPRNPRLDLWRLRFQQQHQPPIQNPRPAVRQSPLRRETKFASLDDLRLESDPRQRNLPPTTNKPELLPRPLLKPRPRATILSPLHSRNPIKPRPVPQPLLELSTESHSEPGQYPNFSPLDRTSASSDDPCDSESSQTAILNHTGDFPGDSEDRFRDAIGYTSGTFAFSSEPVFFATQATPVNLSLGSDGSDEEEILEDEID
jgi:hypothetical protein